MDKEEKKKKWQYDPYYDPYINPLMKRRKEKTEQTTKIEIDWKDFVALAIASLQTILLPVVVFIVLLLILGFLVVPLFG
jgi:hypothetical protein